MALLLQTASKCPPPPDGHPVSARTEKLSWTARLLITAALVFLGVFLVLPLAAVFTEAFRKGAGAYFDSFREADALSAIRLTLLADGND